LPDYVSTETGYTSSSQVVSNNNNGAPRVYLNTGSGWQFDPNYYQIPTYYNTSENLYYFPGLSATTQLVDVNGDNLPDYISTINYYDSDGLIPDTMLVAKFLR
jgi:hypothetical protein